MSTLLMHGEPTPDELLSRLTPRELDVARCLASGMSKQETAVALGISFNTVNRHTTGLMAKLRVHRRADLTRVAIRAGLVEP